MRFHNAAPASHKGFTLVEIAIVMIIIGLLVGGIFGGVRLLDNARVLRTINDLKSAESAALTFKTSYGRPPGDVRNPSLRLQNCTTPPCSNSGNGNSIVGAVGGIELAMFPNITNENFAFWHHLSAADLLNMSIKNSTTLAWGEGEPKTNMGIGGGYRVSDVMADPVNSGICPVKNFRTAIWGVEVTGSTPFKCRVLGQIDQKIDDGQTGTGEFNSWCGDTLAPSFCSVDYNTQNLTETTWFYLYDIKGL